MRRVDITGKRFGRLVATELAVRSPSTWVCKCDCGQIHRVRLGNLRSGHIRSCGCFSREDSARRKVTHGNNRRGLRSTEYGSYHSAKARCTNVALHNYAHYGGRGIEFRFESFEEFLAEVGPKPMKGLSIDRIDVNGHYEPGNVRWATASEQMKNRRPFKRKKI